MNRNSCLGLLGLVAVLAMGCAEEQPESVATNEMPLATNLYYYLRCNSTGWGVDSNSLLVATPANPQVRTIVMKANQAYMIQSGDSCVVTATNQLNGWGSTQKTFGIANAPLVVPGNRTLVEGNGSFSVKFPTLGTFTAQLDVATGKLTIGQTTTPTTKLFRGLGVIADFADRTLEQYTGAGIKSPADLRQQLDMMQAHWAWLSRGQEQYQWDIVRIRLPVNFSATSYAGWGEYRDAVVAEVKKTVPLATYDLDSDGDYDAMWVIASNGSQGYDYMMGGASLNNNAHVFVDGQASQSVQSNATGNFNHELGHLRGLPDLYGTYSTIHQLSIMADSWALPPNDFSAYDRTKLGWATVTTVSKNATGVVLPSANEQMAVAKIPTIRENEYFLIENRVRPSSGYASSGVGYSGLVVWHVLESSDQAQNPPLLAVVPADGVISPNAALDPADLLYPGNSGMTNPFIVKSYYGNQEVFRITNLSQTSGGLQFDVTLSTQSSSSTNLLSNGGVESGTTAPTGWETGGWKPSEGTFTWASGVAHSGSKSLKLTATTSNDIFWQQTLTNLVVGQSYTFCGWVKAENLASAGGDIGANLSAYWVDSSGAGHANAKGNGLGTYDWTKICTNFHAEQSTISLQCRIGHWGADLTGTGYCDDLTLETLNAAF